jgi:hypothetical protein
MEQWKIGRLPAAAVDVPNQPSVLSEIKTAQDAPCTLENGRVVCGHTRAPSCFESSN